MNLKINLFGDVHFLKYHDLVIEDGQFSIRDFNVPGVKTEGSFLDYSSLAQQLKEEIVRLTRAYTADLSPEDRIKKARLFAYVDLPATLPSRHPAKSESKLCRVIRFCGQQFALTLDGFGTIFPIDGSCNSQIPDDSIWFFSIQVSPLGNLIGPAILLDDFSESTQEADWLRMCPDCLEKAVFGAYYDSSIKNKD